MCMFFLFLCILWRFVLGNSVFQLLCKASLCGFVLQTAILLVNKDKHALNLINREGYGILRNLTQLDKMANKN